MVCQQGNRQILQLHHLRVLRQQPEHKTRCHYVWHKFGQEPWDSQQGQLRLPEPRGECKAVCHRGPARKDGHVPFVRYSDKQQFRIP